jgi:preprotein translocase subunit YajC
MRKLILITFVLVSLAFAQEPATVSGSTGRGTTTETVSETGTTSEEAPIGCMGMGGGITGLLPIVGMIAIFYFLIIRPQQKQQKQLREMRNKLQRGDHVVTGGGIHGVISNLKDDVITVKIADGVKIDVDRNSLTVIAQEAQGQEVN